MNIEKDFDMPSLQKEINVLRYRVMREALEGIGFIFKSDDEYLSFLKSRITAIGNSSRGEYDLYLDINSPEGRRFVGTIYDPPKVDEGENYQFIIGKFPPTQPIIPTNS